MSDSFKVDLYPNTESFCAELHGLCQALLLVSTAANEGYEAVLSTQPSAAVYNSVYIRMSTWTPFLWSAAQTLGQYCFLQICL